MNNEQFIYELSRQNTSTKNSHELNKEKRKYQIHQFLQSYTVDEAMKIFVCFDSQSEMSKAFKEVIENNFENTHDNQNSKKTEMDI